MSGKNMIVEKMDEQHVPPSFFSQKFWWFPLLGFIMAAANYGAGDNSVANTPLSTVPTVCAISIFISFQFPLAHWLEKKWKKSILSPTILIASLLLAGSGWGIVLGVKNATVVESIFSNWIYGVTIPLSTSTFMAIFVTFYYASTMRNARSLNSCEYLEDITLSSSKKPRNKTQYAS